MTYKNKTANEDAEALLRGPMCRKNHTALLREEIAVRLQKIVDREIDEHMGRYR